MSNHPVSVEIRTPLPMPVGPLAGITAAMQAFADALGTGPLLLEKHVRQEGTDFVFRFTGHAPDAPEDDDPDDHAIFCAASKDPIR
jgi:hypothetical protein